MTRFGGPDSFIDRIENLCDPPLLLHCNSGKPETGNISFCDRRIVRTNLPASCLPGCFIG